MILIGNQRGGGRDLALHLLKEENDHVRVHELRGFIADDLEGAFKEAYAISRGTRCKQFLFSLSLNPPKHADVPTEDFESAIERVEQKLGLTGQPRAIVFHEKEGRRHAHAVWSRIKAEEMKAVQMSYSGEKLLDVSRELHREHGWKMPRGLVERSERDPRNFTLEEWQHAKRNGVDPRDIKTHIQDAWAMSDSKAAFIHALEERGYRLARGDKRGYVAIDYRGEVYSVSKYASVKTKEVRERLGDPSDLSSVDYAKAAWGSDLLRKAQDWQRELDQRREAERKAFAVKRAELVTRQRAERAAQDTALKARQIAEARERQERFRPGLKGLWDRLRGEHGRIKQQNLREAAAAGMRDKAERDKLVFDHLKQRRDIVKSHAQERERYKAESKELTTDREAFAAAAQEHKPAPKHAPERPKSSRAPPSAPARAPDTLREEFSQQVAPKSEPTERDQRREAFKARRREDVRERGRDKGPSIER
ncbi:relaxase/mobilization nuclease domain-containing protein [Hwanghaeella sp. LZ110]|uniref:relaxase/mobilization nuclease domain-containing protein n=1 Tax=Hwanghaeella sp. LZ110 TaxID=3402810 RepID=UPI003B675284